jgi:hypothetical protein
MSGDTVTRTVRGLGSAPAAGDCLVSAVPAQATATAAAPGVLGSRIVPAGRRSRWRLIVVRLRGRPKIRGAIGGRRRGRGVRGARVRARAPDPDPEPEPPDLAGRVCGLSPVRRVARQAGRACAFDSFEAVRGDGEWRCTTFSLDGGIVASCAAASETFDRDTGFGGFRGGEAAA